MPSGRCCASSSTSSKPATIAVDVSQTHAFSDGLSAGDREELEEALGPWEERIVRAELLPLEVHRDARARHAPDVPPDDGIAHGIIAKAFSAEVITPGVTTTEDVVWWMRQRVNDLGLGEWFPPTVDVQRPGVTAKSSLAETKPVVIQRGDVLHCDFGVRAMGLNTDTQHMALRSEGGRDGRARGPEERARELEPPAGPRPRADEAGPHGQRGAPRRPRRRESGRARGHRSTRTRSATTATAPGRSSASGTASRRSPGAAT